MQKASITIFGCLISLFIGNSIAFAQSCSDGELQDIDKMSGSNDVGDIISCMKAIKNKIENKIPAGAVLPFDGPCPRDGGWRPYEPASGHFVMGARVINGQSGRGVGDGGGSMFNMRPVDSKLSAGSYVSQDVLLKAEIHSPLFNVPTEDIPEIFRDGGIPKFYIMPPFTILQYCEKQ